MARRLALLLAAALVVVCGYVAAHVRLIHPSTKNPLYWQSPGAVGVVIQSDGSADITDGSHTTALRQAIQSWNQVPGSVARLVENTNPAQQARTDWQADDIHLLIFDEDNSSGYFPFGSGIVAITPLWFYSSGRISDADILFNGLGFQFTTAAQPGRFDVQDVGTHELGHLLGLDHTGWSGATMFPYVDTTVILHRSPSADDILGLRSAYPAASFATISGRVERADGSAIRGAQVVAMDQAGRARAGILTNTSGNFLLTGLEADTYTLYAVALDGPVTAANLTGGQTVDIDFQPTWYPGTVTVAAGGSAAAGTLVALPDATINLGRPTDRLPLRATIGQETLTSLRGTSLAAGSTLTASDPDVTVAVQNWLGSAVIFRVTVPAGVEPGHVDLMVENTAGERSVLTAALELAPPNPTVSSVTPDVAGAGGGTQLTIVGTGFRPGARVVLGPRIYTDGEPGGCTVVDANHIQLTVGATTPGVHDLVVVDTTGVEGRLAGAYTAADLPSLASVFPSVGSASGGTQVRIAGSDLAPTAIVRIDGVVQPDTTWESAASLVVVTAPGSAGGPYLLEVENPGGYVASTQFAYVANADPELFAVEPSVGPAAGGSVLTLMGSGFAPTTEVVFGADPVTGLGGTQATSVVYVDSQTLAVVSPPGASGPAAILLREPSTGQAVIEPAGFVYKSKGSGGGGGCHIRAAGPDSGGGSGYDWALWIGALLAFSAWLASRARRQLVPSRAAA